MNGATFAAIKFNFSISLTCQVGQCDSGVSANAALNTPFPHLVNHPNYKIIFSNMMDRAMVTKIHTLPSTKHVFPPP